MTSRFSDPTISQALAAFRDGSLSSRQLVEACLARAESAVELNAFVRLDVDGARAADTADAARLAGVPLKPLSGIPIVVKDNIHAAGLPSTAGTPALAGFIPDEDAPVLRLLREAGAIVLGKTNLHELALGAPRQQGVEMLALPESALRSVLHSTLIIHGRDDQVIPLEVSERMLRLIPHAQMHVFGECGHWVQIEKASTFTRLLSDFLCTQTNEVAA